jgi:hypothetical protein
LQKRKLIGNVFGQKVAPRRKHLTELDENGPKAFKGLPNACATCLFKASTKPKQGKHDTKQPRVKASPRTVDGQLIEAKPKDHLGDGENTKNGSHG